jgi:hypothetical protein
LFEEEEKTVEVIKKGRFTISHVRNWFVLKWTVS